jgi:hypothetical protein
MERNHDWDSLSQVAGMHHSSGSMHRK